MSNIMKGMIVNYTGLNRTTEHTWDYVQRTVSWSAPTTVSYDVSLLSCLEAAAQMAL